MQQDPKQTGSTTTTGAAVTPRWWTETHSSSWDRVKDAMRRDWEQARSDIGASHGRPTSQGAGTAGGEDWSRIEPAYRYGYGAFSQYGGERGGELEWSDGIQAKLKQEWNDLKSGRTWDEVKDYVRRGWDSARRRV